MKLGDWIGFLCLIIALVIMWQFRQILLLIFTAVVLATALNGLVRWIVLKLRIQRIWAVLLVLSLLLVFGILFFGLVMPPFIGQFQKLIARGQFELQELVRWIDIQIKDPPDWFLEQDLDLPSISELTQQVGPFAQNLLGNFFAFFSNSLTTLLQLVLVIVLTIMLLVNPLAYRGLVVRLFPSFYRRRAQTIFSECEVALLNWMGGILLNSVFIATLSGMGLFFLVRIPFVLAHALLAGVFNLVPNIGPVLSVVFPLLVADSPWKALGIIILYLFIQNLESYWFGPMVMQKQLSLLPAMTLSAQLFFASFLGFLGLVLALPLTVVVKTWIEEAFIKDVLDQWQDHSVQELPAQLAVLEPATESMIPVETSASEDESDCLEN
ncbi:MAG: AI-2E family transporter [Symploca sp. SIO2C1]|nr:AI-2E family transporter [Symploca sp. SIO2C1]